MKVICETKQLVLREFFEIDAYELFQMNSDQELMKNINKKPYKSEEEAQFFIQNIELKRRRDQKLVVIFDYTVCTLC